jgi:hypothetical protein
VVRTLGLPIIFLPALFLSMEQMPTTFVPLAVAFLIVRRFLLPRWVAKAGAS